MTLPRGAYYSLTERAFLRFRLNQHMGMSRVTVIRDQTQTRTPRGNSSRRQLTNFDFPESPDANFIIAGIRS